MYHYCYCFNVTNKTFINVGQKRVTHCNALELCISSKYLLLNYFAV